MKKEEKKEQFVQKRVVDTNMYLAVIQEMLKEGKEIPLLITGNSMSPFLIHQRDKVLLKQANPPFHKGDIVFYRRKSGQYVLHRIRFVRYKKQEDKTVKREYYMIGDAQKMTEGPLLEEQIFGIVTAAYRKGKWLKPGNFLWEFFRKVWLWAVPFRYGILKLYGLVSYGK